MSVCFLQWLLSCNVSCGTNMTDTGSRFEESASVMWVDVIMDLQAWEPLPRDVAC